MTRGQHLLQHWSRTQQLVSLSSAEAELNATIKAGCEGLGIANMAREMGTELRVEIRGDSSANDGILHRAGAGKVKHLSVRQLWLQERIALHEIEHIKIPRALNTSDLLTHHWTKAEGGTALCSSIMFSSRSSTMILARSLNHPDFREERGHKPAGDTCRRSITRRGVRAECTHV